MNTYAVLLVLLLAAFLEAGGDALVRAGLRSSAFSRIGFLLSGAVVLFAYGYLVNAPPWDFGRLLGVYVVFFFVIAQLINWLAFGHKPTAGVILGGALIITGGIIVSVMKR